MQVFLKLESISYIFAYTLIQFQISVEEKKKRKESR